MALPLPRYRFTVQEYYRMARAGIFTEDDRVELIEGEIIQMAPIGPGHGGEVIGLTHQFMERLADVALGDAVELRGRHAGLELGSDEVEHFGDDRAGAAHPVDLGSRLAGDHQAGAPLSSAVIRSRLTPSIDWRPSTVRRMPAVR